MSSAWQPYIGTLESIAAQLEELSHARSSQSRLVAVSSVEPDAKYSLLCRKKYPPLFADEPSFGPSIIADQWVANRSWSAEGQFVVFYSAWPSPLDVPTEHAFRVAHCFLTLDQIASEIEGDDKTGHGWIDLLLSRKLPVAGMGFSMGRGLPWDRDGVFYLFEDFLQSTVFALKSLSRNADPAGFSTLRQFLSNNDIELAKILFSSESGLTDLEIQRTIGVGTKEGGKMARRRIQDACEKVTPKVFKITECGKKGRATQHKLVPLKNFKV